MKRSDTACTLIRVRPDTRLKADAVATAKRWTLAEATDAAYDALMKAEGIVMKSTRPAPQREPDAGVTHAA